VGDCTKEEVREYYTDRLISDVPEELRGSLDFEKIYEFFGGKLAHWSDYLTEFTNVDGKLTRTPPPPFVRYHLTPNTPTTPNAPLSIPLIPQFSRPF